MLPSLLSELNNITLSAGSEQFGEGLSCHRPHEGDLSEDTVKRASLQRIVQRHRDEMSRRSGMLQPDMAPLLPDYGVSGLLQRANQTIAGHATRQFHAASTGISSSLT